MEQKWNSELLWRPETELFASGQKAILALFDRLFLNWCQRRDLNPRPKAYESSALPLSYSGNPLKQGTFKCFCTPKQ